MLSHQKIEECDFNTKGMMENITIHTVIRCLSNIYSCKGEQEGENTTQIRNNQQVGGNTTQVRNNQQVCENITQIRNFCTVPFEENSPEHFILPDPVTPCSVPQEMVKTMSSRSEPTHKVEDGEEYGCYLVCPECDYYTVRRSRMAEHLLVHSDKRPISCDKCNYTCKRKGDLRSHKIHRHSYSRPYKCPDCHYTGVSKPQLKKHALKHHNRVTNIHHCPECHFTTTIRSKYIQHSLVHVVKMDP